MADPIGIVVIVIVAVFFLGMGVYAIAAPAALVRPFGITLDAPTPRAEVRAVYGGFGLAIAGVLAYALVESGEMARGIVLTVAVALAGMAVGRVISALLDSSTPFYPNWFYCLVEAVAAVALILTASATSM